jgi:hypothetical protein
MQIHSPRAIVGADGLSESHCQNSGFVTVSFVALKRENWIEALKGTSFP